MTSGNNVPASRTITVGRPTSTPIAPGSASRPISSTSTTRSATSSAPPAVSNAGNSSQTANALNAPTANESQQNASAHVTAPAPPARAGSTATSTSSFLSKVQEKRVAIFTWLCSEWEMKLLALLALVWGIRSFNEQIRGNTLNEMEACRNHPNDRTLQATPLCTRMRQNGDFDPPTKRSLPPPPSSSHSILSTAICALSTYLITRALLQEFLKTTSFPRSSSTPHPHATSLLLSLHRTLPLHAHSYEFFAYGTNQTPSIEHIRRATASSEPLSLWTSVLNAVTYWHFEYYQLNQPCPAHMSLIREAGVLSEEKVVDRHVWIAMDVRDAVNEKAWLRRADKCFLSHQSEMDASRDRAFVQDEEIFLPGGGAELRMRTKLLVLRQQVSFWKVGRWAPACVFVYYGLRWVLERV